MKQKSKPKMKIIVQMLLLALAISAESCGVYLQKRESFTNGNEAVNRRNAVLFAVEDSLQTFSSPNDRAPLSYVGFFSPYYVCGSRGKYVRLYSYSQDNLLKRYVKEKKQIIGWIRRSNMIDIESASLIKRRYLLAVNDYSLLLNPQRYFVNEDSVWLYNSGSLKVVNGKIPLYKPVFLIKHSEKDSSSLVAESPDVPFPYSDLNCAGKWLSRVKIGWVSDKLLSPPVSDSIRKIAIRDSSNIKIPWRGESYLSIKEADSVLCRRMNIVFVLPSDRCIYENRALVTKLLGESKSAISRSIKEFFSDYTISYTAKKRDDAEGKLSTVCNLNDSTAFFDALAVYLSESGTNADGLQERMTHRNGISVYRILTLLESELGESVSGGGLVLVILTGTSAETEKGYVSNSLFSKANFNMLSCQLAGGSNSGSRNFVIQSSNIIRGYAAKSTESALENRLLYLVPGGDSLLHKQSRMREFEDDLYLLDFPNNSCAAGGLIYPGLHKTLSGGKLYRGIEILLEQIGRRQRMMERVIEKGFKIPELQRGERLRDSTLFPDAARAFFGKSQLYAYF